jgi:hypothetical protein
MTYTVYQGSNGHYYGEADIWRHLETDTWNVFCWDSTTDTDWVETPDDRILELTPIDHATLPDHFTTTTTESGTAVESLTGRTPLPAD